VSGDAERVAEREYVAPGEKEISLLELLLVVARRRRLIVRVTVGLALISIAVSLLLPNEYTATTSLLPPQQGGSASAGAALMAQFGGLGSMASAAGGALGLKNPNDLQVALLKSETVEDAMIDRFHLMDLYHARRMSQARTKLEKVVEIENGVKDGLIRVSVTDRNPERAAELANGYVAEFKKFTSTLAVTEASQRRLFFEQQLSQAKNDLANAEEDLKKTEQKTGVLQLDSQDRALIEAVAQLRAQIAAKEVQIRAMQSFASGENPDLTMAEQELQGLKAEEAKMGATPSGASNAPLVPRGVMQESGLEYVRKLRDVKYFETIFDLLARQYEAAKVDEARQGAVVQIVDPATVPDHHSSPKRAFIVIGAVVLGIFFSVLWSLIAEALARIASNPEEQPRLLALRQALFSRK
jgi:tyrosine-protein kinase Etk/Wzc